MRSIRSPHKNVKLYFPIRIFVCVIKIKTYIINIYMDAKYFLISLCDIKEITLSNSIKNYLLVFIFILNFVQVYVYMCVHIYTCVCVHICVCMCKCVCKYMCVYV